MKILIRLVKGGLVFLILVLLFSTAQADKVTMYIRGAGIKQGANPVTATQGTTILLYHQKGSRDVLDKDGLPTLNGAGDQTDTPLILETAQGTPIDPVLKISAGSIQTAANQAGDRLVQVDVQPGETIYARVWSPSTGKGENYYNIKTYSFPNRPAFDTLTNPTWDWTNLDLAYKASAPPTPSINRAGIVESLVREGETNNYSVSLTVPVVKGSGYGVESETYSVKVWRDDLNDDPADSGPTDVRVKDSASTSFTFDNNTVLQPPYNTYFQGAKTYHMKVRAYNIFGSSIWSEDIKPAWTTGGGGGGGILGVGRIDWVLKKPSTGVNTISFPFNLTNGAVNALDNTVVAQKSGSLTVKGLIDEINRQAGGNIVTVFGWYDAATQQHIGLTSIPNGDLTSPNITAVGKNPSNNMTAYTAAQILTLPIVTDQPYQVTTNTDNKTITLQGNK